ncbi:MAG: molybdopterin-dependent oxidoreductase, partial [Rhodospirillaceae bacterium]
MSVFKHAVCPHDCPSTCLLEVEKIDERTIGRVRGAKDNSYTAGVVCEKVGRYAERTHHPGRLTTPLRRVGAKGSGRFAPVGWDEALDEVADAFRRAAARDGSEAVWPLYYAGTMGLLMRDGINRLRHVMKYSGQHSTICNTLVFAGWHAGVGAKYGPDPEEMADADLIIVWGGNPVSTQVNAMTHISRARKTRGAKLVVVDPYRSPTAEAADIHVAPRPGTDGALACAMMHVLFRDGYADRDYMARYADDPAALEAHVRDRPPDWASRITGVPAAEIEAFAQLYGRTERALIRVCYGFSRSRNGAANVHAVTCLPTVGGKWKAKGGGAVFHSGDLYRVDKSLIEGLDRADASVRVLDQSQAGPILTGDAAALKGGPPVTAMLIQSTNPAIVSPDAGSVQRGLRRDDLFVCVHEQFMTDTAKLADIVLPATTFLEHNDLYFAGGHPHLMVGPKVIDGPGETRSNHDMLCGLAARLGADHPGFALSDREIVDAALVASGYPGFDETVARRWINCQPEFDDAHFLNGFPQPGGRFRFRPDWAKHGPDHAVMPPLPDHMAVIDETDAEHPFRMVTAPARTFLNSTFTETPTSKRRQGRPTAMIHPDDCAALGLADGDPVRVGNRRGEVHVVTRAFDGLQRGVIVVESIWPGDAFDDGIGINKLTSPDPGG